MAFNLAVAALKGWPEIADYTAERTQEPAVRAFMQRIHNVPDPEDGSVNLAIVTKDGKRFEKNRKHAPEDPSFGLQEERIMEKFRTCAAFRLSNKVTTELADKLANFEKLADVSKF